MQEENVTIQKRKGLNMMLVLVVLVGLAAVVFAYYSMSGRNSKSSQTTQVSQTSQSDTGVRFVDTPGYSNSFQIYPGALSAEAQAALTGFTLSSAPQSDGSTLVSLAAQVSGYQTQQFSVKPGETLYFIEMNSGDDSTANKADLNPADDRGVVVDSSGFVK
jgi:hypothetical protein